MSDLIKSEQSFDAALKELESMQGMCAKLMQMKHYQRLGDVGIFAILQKAKSVGLNPLDALNGGMYFVNGKVELSANTMNYLIRQAGHSIVKDEKSNKEICILKGKRADNGDTFTCSFSIEDAKKAGIYKNVWQSYPEDMLFARALTRLARQLFPDVTKGCYVEGEIPRDIEQADAIDVTPAMSPDVKPLYITKSQADELSQLISECDPEKQEKIWGFMEKKCGGDLLKFPAECYENTKRIILERRAEYMARHQPTSMDEVLEVDDGE